MYAKKLGMFVILSLSIATVVMGTAGLNLVSPVIAGGDHHDHGGKKECKKNDNNNCNDTEKNQKLSTKTECENENTIKDHSDDNENGNILVCSTDAANVKNSLLNNSRIFGDTIEPNFPQ
jgi:hypothetical protein